MKITDIITEAANPAQQAAIAISMKKAGKKPKSEGVAEGLPQTLRKVVPGYAKREIDKKMDAGKFGKTDADKDANFQRYKKIQDKIKEQGVAEGSLEQRVADKKKNNPLQASVKQSKYGYSALVTYNTGETAWHGGAYWQTPELAMGHAKAFINGYPHLEQEYAQKFINKNRDGIVQQGVAEGSLEEYGDTARGQKMLAKVHHRAADRVTSKQADKDPAYARKAQQTQDRAWERLAVKEQGVAEGSDESVSLRDMVNVVDKHYPKYYAELSGSDISDKQFERAIVNAYKAIVKKQGVAEGEELAEEFDLIESIVEMIAEHNGVDAEAVWEDLESLTEDELYVFAVTSDPLMESEAWQKANKRDKTDGMSQKAVNTYRREHPGSKLKTAVTTKPSKLKKGGKASKRRKSYCSRSRGQMKMHSISCAKTPDKAICKARRRWNC